jgi:creatinine amidohydrolase
MHVQNPPSVVDAYARPANGLGLAMAVKSRWWWDLSTRDFAELDGERAVAILPVGAVEQHGPHLPVKVDAAIGWGIVTRAVELMRPDCPALVLPPLPYGKSDEHLAFPGTLTLSYETLGKVWSEIGESVYRAGIRKILFLNSHGGQPQLLEIVCRDLRVRLGMFAATAMWPQLIDMTDLFDADEIRHGIHGGQIETSVMLHLAPDSVVMSRAENFEPATTRIARDFEMLGLEGVVKFGWQAQDLHPKGACGDATRATAELGRMVVERAAARLVALVDEIARYPLAAVATRTAFDRAGPI